MVVSMSLPSVPNTGVHKLISSTASSALLGKYLLTNVCIFDGCEILHRGYVVIDAPLIGSTY